MTGKTRRSSNPAAVCDAKQEPGDLLVAVSHGEQGAFEHFHELMASRVLDVITRVLRDPAQAEEVAQEVLVEVWRTAARFDPACGSADSWCSTIAHRRAVDRVRTEQATTERLHKVGAASIDIPYDCVADEVADRLERQHLRCCLGHLTGLQHQAIILAYYDDHSYPRVAEILGTTLPTVKSRIRGGIIRLRKCLQPRE